MTFKSILTSSVTFGLLAMPLAAQAGTRPQVSTASAHPAVAEAAFSDFGARKSTSVRKENGIQQAGGIILVGLAGAAMGAAVYAIADDGDSNKSRGAN